MKEVKINHLAYVLKNAQAKDKKPIFFLGAGASRSGGIPLAREICTSILKDFQGNPFIDEMPESEQVYANLMDCLLPDERDELLRKYIAAAKINVTHIYLAQLIKEEYIDYILTVNFDNLMLRALALYNIFPPTYDMAILKDLTTSTFQKKSVVYLHGQNHGLWLLNTPEEMQKVKNTVPRVFDAIKDQRPWIFIGYSGDDPIFDHIQHLGKFANGLFWITYQNNDPSSKVQAFLSAPNTNAFVIKGYDSDSFMLKLNKELGLEQPTIIDKPFTALHNMLEEIVDIDEEEHYRHVKERLNIAKRQAQEAIQQFEKGEVAASSEEQNIDIVKKQIIDILISQKYEESVITELEQKVKISQDTETQNLLAGVYSDWGVALTNLALTKQGKEREGLFNQAFEKYKQATTIKPDDHEAWYNWGNDLTNLARTKQGKEAEGLFQEAFEKYHQATTIKPDDHEAWNNWGAALADLAQTKQGKEAEGLFQEAFEKYHQATTIKPDFHEAWYNWGNDLTNLARTKQGKEAEDLFQQAFEKYKKATTIKQDYHAAWYNWGNVLLNLALTKQGKEREGLFQEAFEKYHQATTIKQDYHEAWNNWGGALADLARTKQGKEAEGLFQEAFEKYHQARTIKPDYHEAWNNWGIALANLAQTKQGEEREDLFQQAFEKYHQATTIKPDSHEAWNNWGIALANLAQTKQGEEREDLFQQAFEKYHQATTIKTDKHEAWNNWGIALTNLALTKQGKEREGLFQQASQKYYQATTIKPDKHEAWYNWGNALADLALTKQGKEQEELFRGAEEKYNKAIEFGGSSYNLACLYALQGKKDQALEVLEVSLSKHEIAAEYVEKDDDWKDLYADADFMRIIAQHKTSR